MCLAIIAYKYHPRYRLIIAANRDEYYSRPADFLNFWKENPEILAGRDLKCGGTWLGITRKGRFSLVTNYRDPKAVKEGRPSRGLLVKRYLESDIEPLCYLRQIKKDSSKYNPFNLIVGNRDELWYYSNRADIKRLEPGIYGLSNHLLDTPWPKIKKAKKIFKQIIAQKEIDTDTMFELLRDNSFPPDNELPDTGIGYEKERMLSPIFIQSPDYGTRSSYVLLLEEKVAHFFEIIHQPKQTRSEFHIMLN